MAPDDHAATRVAAPVPPGPGVGLKGQHVADILRPGAEAADGIAFLEIHAENYMGDGGPALARLEAVRARYPLSLHGVGLSIGGPEPLDGEHLKRLRTLADRFAPGLFSEHLAWSTHEGVYFNDLLPLPYTAATLDRVAAHVSRAQDAVGMRMLLENPSTYVVFEEDEMDEIAFLEGVVARTGCGLLLDVNNVFVSCTNRRADAADYLARFPLDAVGEIHLAGHLAEDDGAGGPLLVDTHDRPVADPVWRLYADAIRRAGRPIPTLLERDGDVPGWADLAAEARTAGRVMADALAERPPGPALAGAAE